jgi:hypothetical protein
MVFREWKIEWKFKFWVYGDSAQTDHLIPI